MKAIKKLLLIVDLIKERRLPWSISHKIAQAKLKFMRWHYDRLVLSTRPYVTGKEFPHFEIHTLLSHNHVGMVLWSIKSLLHYSGRMYHVVLHDDGSLSSGDIEVLKKHLINVKVMQKSDADVLMELYLSKYPSCHEYRYSSKETSDHRGNKYNMRIFSLRLFDFNLGSQSTKTLVLDADVLFFKQPQEIMAWAEEIDDRGSLYSIEQYKPIWNYNSEVIGFEYKDPLPTDANAGLLCLDKRAYDLDSIELWIDGHRELMDKYATFEQAAYNHLLKSKRIGTPLPDSYSFNYTDEDVVATHFAIKNLFFDNLHRLSNVLR